MTELDKVGRLQIEQDERFQRASWRAQRIAWAALVVIVVLALLGAFGNGPLAHARAGDPAGPLFLRYDRVVRRESPTILLLDVRNDASADSVARIWIAQAYVDVVDIQRITPEPERSFVAGDRIIYEFSLAPGSVASRITFQVQPLGYWSQRGAIGLVNGPSYSIRQFMLP